MAVAQVESTFYICQMEVKKEYLKFYVETERRNRLSPTEIHQKIVTALGEEHISLHSVQVWCRSAKAGGDVTFIHRQGAGRPRSSRSEENMNDVKDLVTHCPHLSVEEICQLDGYQQHIHFPYHI